MQARTAAIFVQGWLYHLSSARGGRFHHGRPPRTHQCGGKTAREVIAESGAVVRDLDFFEIFAGSARLTHSFKSDGKNAIAFDRRIHPADDLLTDVGFARALSCVVRLRERALCWMAPECSWWTFASSSLHARNKKWTVDGKSTDLPQPHVEGNSAHSGVRDSNGVARRVAYLAQICTARGVEVVIEQPADSAPCNCPHQQHPGMG